MLNRSNHIPTFTRSDAAKRTGIERRARADQKTCGTTTLQKTIVQ